MKRDEHDELLTPEQLAAKLQVCRATIYNYLSAGMIPHLQLLSGIRFTRQNVADFLSSCAVKAKRPKKRRKAGKRKQAKKRRRT